MKLYLTKRAIFIVPVPLRWVIIVYQMHFMRRLWTTVFSKFFALEHFFSFSRFYRTHDYFKANIYTKEYGGFGFGSGAEIINIFDTSDAMLEVILPGR
jgi:hypothetical protein